MNNEKEFFMKSRGWLIVGITVLLPIVMASCGSNKSGGKASVNSEVIVRRVDSNAATRIRVFIDGKQTGTLRIGETATYRVKNGEHTIFVNSDSYADREPQVLEFTSYQSRHIFAVTDGMLSPLSAQQQAAAQADISASPYTSVDLDTAIQTSFDIITKDLKRKAKVAIINIASDNPSEGTFIIEELTYLTVHSKKKFVVIDRRKIEAIRIEKNFNRTSDYEDDFLVSIGHLLGAEVVITGNLNGNADLRRLRIKALNVKTGQLIGMASEKV
jgi:predicted nucleic acid-binding protein